MTCRVSAQDDLVRVRAQPDARPTILIVALHSGISEHDPSGSAAMQAAWQDIANIRCLRAVLTELRTRSGPGDGASR